MWKNQLYVIHVMVIMKLQMIQMRLTIHDVAVLYQSSIFKEAVKLHPLAFQII